MARSSRAQGQQLPTESQVFEDEVLAGTASVEHPAEEMSESDTIIQESYRKSTNRALRQVIYFVGVRGFGEALKPATLRLTP